MSGNRADRVMNKCPWTCLMWVYNSDNSAGANAEVLELLKGACSYNICGFLRELWCTGFAYLLRSIEPKCPSSAACWTVGRDLNSFHLYYSQKKRKCQISARKWPVSCPPGRMDCAWISPPYATGIGTQAGFHTLTLELQQVFNSSADTQPRP